MKPAPFKYLVAESLEQALALKAEHADDAIFLAGGQSLIPAMNFRLAQPALLLDLNALTPLDYAEAGNDGALRIGALTRHRTLVHDVTVARHQPLVQEAAAHVAHPQIRNRGTLCGNLAHADPASELPAVMLAMDARLRAQSAEGERWIAASDFFISVFTTALHDDEMLVEVELPALPAGTGTCFMEVARRPGDYAMMGVAAVVTLDENETCAQARLTYCNAGETPVSAEKAADSLAGERINEQLARDAGALAQGEIDPPGNVHASKDFQRHLVGVLTRRALLEAADRARAARG
jgi:carbon-monoxide dehydrogenase medium subunit